MAAAGTAAIGTLALARAAHPERRGRGAHTLGNLLALHGIVQPGDAHAAFPDAAVLLEPRCACCSVLRTSGRGRPGCVVHSGTGWASAGRVLRVGGAECGRRCGEDGRMCVASDHGPEAHEPHPLPSDTPPPPPRRSPDAHPDLQTHLNDLSQGGRLAQRTVDSHTYWYTRRSPSPRRNSAMCSPAPASRPAPCSASGRRSGRNSGSPAAIGRCPHSAHGGPPDAASAADWRAWRRAVMGRPIENLLELVGD